MLAKLYTVLGTVLWGVSATAMITLSYIYLDRELTEGAMLKQYYWAYLITFAALAGGSYLRMLGERIENKIKKRKKR